MEFYKQNIIAFIQIMEQHHDLFSEHKAALNDLLENLPEDAEQISDAISAWYEDRLEINKAQNNAINCCKETLQSSTARGFGGSLPPPLDDKKLKEKLLNAIRRFTPSSQSQEKPNEPSKKKSD